MAVPNVNQHYDCVVIKTWQGVFDGSTNKTKNDVLAALVNPGDVAFVTSKKDPSDTSPAGRFLYLDNDTVKSSVLFNADIFSQYQSHTRVRTVDTKYQRKTVIVKPKSNIFDSSVNPATVKSNDVAAIHLTLQNYLVVGEYNTYMKDGYVQLNTTMTQDEMLFQLAKSLVSNMKRDVNLGINVCLGTYDSTADTGYSAIQVTKAQLETAKSVSDVTTGYDCIIIQEEPLKWELGRFYNERPSFDVTTSLTEIGVAMPVEMAWAEDVTDYTFYDRGGVPNGRAAAEIEYFCQAQRGDKWGKGGYPYTFHADGLIDPTKEYDVAIFNITYRGDAEDVQYSPKQLYVFMEKANSAATPLNTVMTDIAAYLH